MAQAFPMSFTKKLNSLSNVVPGSTATLKLNLGVAYEMIKFTLTDITPAEMLNLKLKINGRVVQTYADGNELQELNNYKGYNADAAGYLTWYFVMPELNTFVDRRHTMLGTADVQTMSIEFDVDAAALGAAVTASARVTNNAPLGVIKKVLRFPFQTGVGGIQEIDNLPTNGARIPAVHFKKADIKAVEVEANAMKIFEAAQVEAREYQKDYGRAPDTDYFHVDFTLSGESGQALKTVGFQDFRFKLDHTAAGSGYIIVEYLDTLMGGV